MSRERTEYLIFCSFLGVFFISSSSSVTLLLRSLFFSPPPPQRAHDCSRTCKSFPFQLGCKHDLAGPHRVKIPRSILKRRCFFLFFFFIYFLWCRESFVWRNSRSRFAHCLFGFGFVFSLTPCVAETPPVEQSKNWVRASEYQKRSLIIVSVYCQASFFCQIKKEKRKTLQTKGWHI